MRPFHYNRPDSAVRAVAAADAGSQYLGGGTTLTDLMKLDVMRPTQVVDITGMDGQRHDFIAWDGKALRIGALTTMAALADDDDVRRRVPMLSDALWLAASPQIRNMARLGGNVLQRTRCPYYRDTSYDQCNKRVPGSGCAALEGGVTRSLAVLGTSPSCIATYPGDFAQALIALDAIVEILGKGGPRSLRFADLHRLPQSRPDIETTLQQGDLITAFSIPDADFPRSRYLKVRDRESYAYALASTAGALRMEGDTIADIRIGLGGVATVPWRAREAEAALRGGPLDEARLNRAADIAFAGASATEHNKFKIDLGKRTMVRAFTEIAGMEG
ncbi:FAD binding domain-containing protein [Croceicoccus marinus]|jgi:xanthine dehydrogenase YagS FAD-binding subunit|uniref:Xanthine dehydrogenase family protein subunit M n=1 Tax=Croceicoccus marinus TaxID=450378 RepID=A0A7G6VVA5_9SPHN|nr:xanthine dehydrogenase family protein subunit M [Croceicoccus marinus]QNE05670.1 xanthine dehydrogenase family protein subunit M [Croceicoccus marinus]